MKLGCNRVPVPTKYIFSQKTHHPSPPTPPSPPPTNPIHQEAVTTTTQPSFIFPGLGSTILLAELQFVQPYPLSAVTLVPESQPFIEVEIPDPSATLVGSYSYSMMYTVPLIVMVDVIVSVA